jgi:N-acetylmuramoyl-L-alanine amidase
MRISLILFVLFTAIELCASTQVSLNQVWPNLRQSSISDDLDLKLRVPSKFQIMNGSHLSIIEGKFVKLKEKTVFTKNQWLVSSELVQLARSKGWIQTPKPLKGPITSGPLIVIDAGHGGKDPGAIGLAGLMEKDVALDISKRLNLILTEKRIRVHMIRSTDVFVNLHKRCEIANKKNAALFVSIHCNANLKRSIHGYQLYRLDSKRITSSRRAKWSRQNNYDISKHAPTDKKGNKKFFNSFESLFRWKDAQSDSLTKLTNEHFKYRQTNITLMPKQNFCVLRETFAPAFLVEADFISNFSAEAKMTSSSWRQRVAEDIAKGILSYLGIITKS